MSASCLSQCWTVGFTAEGVGYRTAEHYMTAAETRLSGDAEAEERILAADRPRDAEFGRNPELREFLLGTGRRVLVEASPRDRVWGVGLGAENDDARVPERWRGLNLLGFALMETRARLAAAP
ncbi:NADAR family protein [Nocardiopsis sp. RV163]|uniref:NADAR family protein n=1 Tax=Nocardiopsis sp. RV163 TaxID=1661388 RepID=UPI0009E399DD